MEDKWWEKNTQMLEEEKKVEITTATGSRSEREWPRSEM